ncbi:MAG: serine/threonine-protein kinase [Polyangiaceae bacterium]
MTAPQAKAPGQPVPRPMREASPVSAARPIVDTGALGGAAAAQYASSMASDSSNARSAPRDPTDGKKETEATGVGGELQSGKTPHAAPILSDAPAASVDPDEEGRALLSELTVGSVVDGKYRVDEVLGRGAMGVVVAATHLQLGERVALKFLRYRAKAGVNDDFQSRFRREARVSAKLRNEHITRVIDVGVWREHVPYMVMDYLAGTDLRDVMKSVGAMPIGTALEYAVQVCEGIAEAHANGVVHRDLKPSNLFVTKRPDGSDLIKILDFGISKWSVGEAGVDELTQTGVVLGSPKYMAPEQLFGSADVDARADVWSVGAIVYEMLCGRPPFDQASFTKICAELSTDRMPPSLVERRPEIPPELEAVVMNCFARTPEKRIQNVAELAGDLLAAVHAPFADAVRSKIGSTLDPATRDPLLGSGGMGGVGTGSFGSILSQSGSRRAIQVGSAPSAESTGASPISISGALAPPERKRWPLWLAAVGLLVVGGGVFLAMSSGNPGKGDAKASAGTGGSTAMPTSSPPLDVAPATATAASPPSSTAGSTATAVASVPSAPGVVATPPHVVVRGGWHPPPRTTGAPPVTVATAAPPVTAAPPATTAAPASTVKADPLGDRQ